MPGLVAIKLTPLSRLVFKPPQPFEAGVHGPGSHGSTLSYPMPGTIAGALARITFSRINTANKPNVASYEDLELYLSKLLGREFRLYTGLLEAAGRLYVYVNTSVFPPLDEAVSRPREAVEKAVKGLVEAPVRVLRTRLTGIALDKASKSVVEDMLYSLESIIYQPRASILAIAVSEDSTINGEVLKLGSKTGAAIVNTENLDSSRLARVSGRYTILLISPAILMESPLEGPLILNSERTYKGLGMALLHEAGISGAAEVIMVPKGENELSVQTTGWSLLRGRPRPPMLIVPPGTLLRATLDNVEAVEVKIGGLEDYFRLVGLGCYSNLGWGTGLLIDR